MLSNKSVSQPLEWCGEPVWYPTDWVYLTLPEIVIPQITWHFLSARLLVTQLVDCCLCIALVQQRSNISQELHEAAQQQSECMSDVTTCNGQSALRNYMLSSRVWIGPSLSKVRGHWYLSQMDPKCAVWAVRWPCGIFAIAVKTLSHGKTIFLRLFFLCSFRKKTWKLVSLFIFRH